MLTRGAWGRAGPWLTPAMIAVEAGLAWSGLLSVWNAIMVAVAVELLLAAVVVSRTIAAVRRFRAGRRERADFWVAAEGALAQLVPRRFARFLLLEARLWACLARWVAGRHKQGYGYHGGVRPLIWVAVGLVVVEGAVLDVVLALAIPGSPWLWVAAGVHAYALLLLLGFCGSLVTRPHLLGEEALLLRESVVTEVAVPYAAILGMRTGSYPGYGRSWFKVYAEREVATLAYTDANIVLTLDREIPLLVNGSLCDTPLGTLYLTADDPRAFVAAIDEVRQAAGAVTA
ncbi:MAG: hypothetical protein ACRDMV_11225 [Streptosporangiales bacterium]